MPRWLSTLIRLTPIVGLSSAASLAGLMLFRIVAPSDTLAAASSSLGNYLQTLGAIYSVLLAFVVFVVWGQYNDLRAYLDREANALVDLHRTASGLPTDTRLAIHRALTEYVDRVLNEEWTAMSRDDDAAIDRAGDKLDEVWLAIHRCKPIGCQQELMYGEALARFNDLNDMRTNRVTAAKFRVPLTMKLLLYTGAVILVGSMYLVYIPELWLHGLVTAALGGAIAHVLYLIHDLDDSFTGNLQVDKAPYLRARASFDRVVRLMPVEPDE